MKYIELLNLAADYFAAKGIDSARLDAEILLASAANIRREKLLASLNEETPEKTVDYFRKLTRLRAGRIPLAYITGKKEFYGHLFFVNENCLVPRPETEQMIDLIINEITDKNRKLKILDLCCGPGTISISLLKYFLNAHSTSVDICCAALSAFYTNAEYHSLLNRINIIEADVLSEKFYDRISDRKFDLIVCNPPYVSAEEYSSLEPEVKKEPRKALVPPEDQLIFYKIIIDNIAVILESGGAAFFEISESIFAKLQNIVLKNKEIASVFFDGLNGKPNIMKITR